MSYEVEYYELPDGSRPAEEFILAQDVKMQAKIFMALEFLEEKGPMLREPFSKRWVRASSRCGQNREQTSAGCCTSL